MSLMAHPLINILNMNSFKALPPSCGIKASASPQQQGSTAAIVLALESH